MVRLLGVSIRQALRSLTIALLPLAFIALFTWATAGSATGNTADPIRAALWFLLAAHQVPLQLSQGYLSYLPLGALILPIMATRSGYRRIVEELGEPQPRRRRAYLLMYSLTYSILVYLVALIAMNQSVSAPFYTAIPIIFLVTFLSCSWRAISLPMPIRLALFLVIGLIGIAMLIAAISLAWHLSTVINLTQVIAPGIFGGVTFLLIQILYLPNLGIATIGYLAGVGFSLGNGSLISPLIHRVEEIPAIPLLAALPLTSHPWALLFVSLNLFLGFISYRWIISGLSSHSSREALIRFYLTFFLALLILGFEANGQLLSSNLASVGALWWQMPIATTLEFIMGSLIAGYGPQLLKKIPSRIRP